VPPVPPAVIPQQEGAPATPIAERFNPQNPHVATAIEMAERYNLPRNVFLSLVQQESRFRPNAVSRAGALGLGQLMPGTARDLGVDPTNPEQNLEGSARYLRQQLDRFGGDMTLALAAYNAGPRRVAEAGNAIPNNAETQAYVPSVMRRAGVPGYAEGGTVTAIPVHEINVVATRLPRRRTPRPAPREELTADQLNAMVLDRLAARYDVAPESIMAAEARDRIGRAMGYAEGGRVNSDWSRYLPEDMPDTAFNDLQQTMTYRPLNARRLIDAGAIRITQPGSGVGPHAIDTPDPERYSLVTRHNDRSPDSYTRAWSNKPESYESAIEAINQPGLLYDGKYRQILQSARELGLSPDEVFLPERESRAEGGLADLHQKYARGGDVISDEEYDRRLLERMKRDTGRTTESTNAEQARAIRSAGYDAAQLASDIFLPQSPLDAALMVALGPGGRMARLAGSTALMAMEPSEAEAGGLRRLVRAYRGRPDEPPMIAMHNTRPERLERMAEREGVAVAPSIGISRADEPMDSFGDISLMVSPQTINPSKTPVYGRDAYTPRYPNVETRNVRGEDREVIRVLNENTGEWRSLPHTPENALRVMRREPWRGGEDFITDNWLLAQLTPQFRNMSELRTARDRLVPGTDTTVANWTEGLDDLRSEWLNAGGNAADWRFADSLQRNLAEAAQRGPGGMEYINRSYYRNAIPEDLLERTRAHLEAGRDLPTTYFEAKPRRIVPLNEFQGAVVPEQASKDVTDLLRRYGVDDIQYYNQGDTADRAAQIRRFERLMFGAAPVAAGAAVADLDQKYAEGGAVSAQPAIYDPDAVNTLANQIEAGYV
jgi:hypothetical protein